ncbi:hypothetical protein IHV25_05545 [Phaeovibrio sulfidiphilus]|uniref:Uncharacterized protein n=1 Tax=Phaeovibrio sulfidiphilus TaxID=1220600 RepID=A0A8J6YVE6_9PROT|nr:hypothetical protein [Phaeovibrio sulfidiphilus]MBE1237109.1 hypothetical protein [Phaeovibrio sulfidiphilus]
MQSSFQRMGAAPLRAAPDEGRSSGRFVPPGGGRPDPQARDYFGPSGPYPEVPFQAAYAAGPEAEGPSVLRTTPFQSVGRTLRDSMRYLFETHARYLTLALLLFMGVAGALLVLGWARGFPITSSEAWSILILGYGAVGFLLAFLISLVVLHWLTVWLSKTLTGARLFRPTPRKPLGERLFFLVTFIASVWGGYTSYYGFQIVFFSPEEGIRYWLVPLLAGLIACSFVFTFWVTLFERMEMSSLWQKLVLLLIIAPAGAAIIFGMSTATGVLGIGGDAAITYHMRLSVDAMQDTLNDIRQERDREYDRLIPIMTQTAQRFERLADEEERRGTLTQAAGAGAVSNYLRDLGRQAEATARDLEEQRRVETLNMIELNDNMRKLREAFGNRGRKFRAQLETLVRDMNAVQSEIGKVIGASPLDLVRFQVASMRGIRPLTPSSVNRAFADSQKEVMANLEGEKNSTLSEIERSLQQLQKEASRKPPGFMVMHDLEAIVVYWRQVWLSWAISIAVDMGPFLWILVAAVMPMGNYLQSQKAEEAWIENNYPEAQA